MWGGGGGERQLPELLWSRKGAFVSGSLIITRNPPNSWISSSWFHGGYLWGIASASTRGKNCMRIFCRKAQEQIRIKCIVELLVLWQLDIVVGVNRGKVNLLLLRAWCVCVCVCTCVWDSGPQGLCSLACKACFALGHSPVLFQNVCRSVLCVHTYIPRDRHDQRFHSFHFETFSQPCSW